MPATANRVASMATLFMAERPVEDYDSAMRADRAAYGRLFQALLGRGVYFPPAQFEAFFTSRAHGDEEIDRTIEAARAAFASLAE